MGTENGFQTIGGATGDGRGRGIFLLEQYPNSLVWKDVGAHLPGDKGMD